jgi:hypothetical protein
VWEEMGDSKETTMKTFTKIQLAAAVTGAMTCQAIAGSYFCQGLYGLAACMFSLALINVAAAFQTLRP